MSTETTEHTTTTTTTMNPEGEVVQETIVTETTTTTVFDDDFTDEFDEEWETDTRGKSTSLGPQVMIKPAAGPKGLQAPGLAPKKK